MKLYDRIKSVGYCFGFLCLILYLIKKTVTDTEKEMHWIRMNKPIGIKLQFSFDRPFLKATAQATFNGKETEGGDKKGEFAFC